MVLAIPLIIILAALIAYGSASLARQTAKGWVSWVENQVLSTVFGFEWIAAQTVKLASHVAHELGLHFREVEHTAAAWVASLANYVDVVGKATLFLPFEFSRFAYWLVRHEIPTLIKAIPGQATKVIHATSTRVVRIERTIVKLPKLSRAQAKALVGAAVATFIGPYLGMLHWLRAHFHAMTAVIPHVLPIPFGRTITAIRKRLRRLERLAAGGVAVAAVIAALGRLRLGWLRCTKVGKTGRAVCGLDTSLFDSLLLDAVAIASIISVVEFARDLSGIEHEAVTIMGRLIREFPDSAPAAKG